MAVKKFALAALVLLAACSGSSKGTGAAPTAPTASTALAPVSTGPVVTMEQAKAQFQAWADEFNPKFAASSGKADRAGTDEQKLALLAEYRDEFSDGATAFAALAWPPQVEQDANAFLSSLTRASAQANQLVINKEGETDAFNASVADAKAASSKLRLALGLPIT